MIIEAQDEVDKIVEAWRRELPDADFGQKALVLRLISVSANLEAVAAQACSELGIDLSLYKILSELRRASPAFELKPKELIRCLPISSGGLTSLIDRAESAGLAVRRPDPDDRRGVVVALTERGKRTIEAAATKRAQAEDRALNLLAVGEQQALNTLLKRLLSQFPSLAPR